MRWNNQTLLFGCLAATVFSGADGPSASRNYPERQSILGVDHCYRLADGIYSGAQPESEAGYAALAKMGIKLIISVDGDRPPVDWAKKNGLRYVHVPVAYGGIGRAQAAQLVEAAKSETGPIFIHCHHGKHRGPAAAAMVCMATQRWNADQAIAWLKTAGTDPKYAGLYRDVGQFQVPTETDLKNASERLAEIVPPKPIVKAMLQIEHGVTLIKEAALQETARKSLSSDASKSLEAAKRLHGYLRDLRQSPAVADRPKEFLTLLDGSLVASDRLVEHCNMQIVAKVNDAKAGDIAIKRLERSCDACHEKFRN